MNPTDWWVGEGGDAYTQRNRVDWRKRLAFWKDVLKRTYPGIVFEMGCNTGANLRAIHACGLAVRTVGIDLNFDAATTANQDVPPVYHKSISEAEAIFSPGTFDMTFTAGCLIHVPPTELVATMRALAALSNRYVLAIEYEAAAEEEIEYQGQMGLLWKRPYGKLYEALGLSLDDTWDAGDGFDRCTAWLLRK